MFAGNAFYHGTTKHAITAFVRLFADIVIQRQNNTDTIEQTIAVPIAYSNKEKLLRRVESDPTLNNHTRVSLPRIAFEITGYHYDAARALNRNATLVCNSSDPDEGRKQVYTPTPWDLEISMYIVTKSQEDGLQILEQILPTFRPEYTLNLNLVPEMNIANNVPVILNGVTASDNALGSYENDQRIVIHTLSFTMKINFYGPVQEAKIIKHVTANVKDGFFTYKADGTIPTEPITETWLYDF